MPRDRLEKKQVQKKGAAILAEIGEDIRSLNSSILIIGQKMKYLVRNEKILGRNLIVLNKKLHALEDRISTGNTGAGGAGAELSADATTRLDEIEKKLNEIEAELSSMKQGLATQDQLQELKYIIDSINPLELATLEQVKGLIEEKIEKGKKKQ